MIQVRVLREGREVAELPAADPEPAVRLRLGAGADGGLRRRPVGLFQAEGLAVDNTGMDELLAEVQARVAERFPADLERIRAYPLGPWCAPYFVVDRILGLPEASA
jgi:hypothetical protein